MELCRRLDAGGLTPALADIVAARSVLSIPLHVLIRPREGAFVHSGAGLEQMVTEIGAARAAGADGVVIGVLTAAGAIDRPALQRLVETARPLSVTFHRAFDEIADQPTALAGLISLGVDRVLTAGGMPTAVAGAAQLRRLVQAAAGRIVVMAGGSVRPGNVLELVRQSGVTEVHARMDDDPGRARALKRALQETGEPRAESGELR